MINQYLGVAPSTFQVVYHPTLFLGPACAQSHLPNIVPQNIIPTDFLRPSADLMVEVPSCALWEVALWHCRATRALNGSHLSLGEHLRGSHRGRVRKVGFQVETIATQNMVGKFDQKTWNKQPLTHPMCLESGSFFSKLTIFNVIFNYFVNHFYCQFQHFSCLSWLAVTVVGQVEFRLTALVTLTIHRSFCFFERSIDEISWIHQNHRCLPSCETSRKTRLSSSPSSPLQKVAFRHWKSTKIAKVSANKIWLFGLQSTISL